MPYTMLSDLEKNVESTFNSEMSQILALFIFIFNLSFCVCTCVYLVLILAYHNRRF